MKMQGKMYFEGSHTIKANQRKSENQRFVSRAGRFLFQKKHHLYVDKQYLYNIASSKTILEQLSQSHENKELPYILRVENGIVLPRKNVTNGNVVRALGGVLNEQHIYLEESREYDFGGGYDVEEETIEKRDEAVIYLGRGFPHFGVVMVDLIRRLYFKYSEEGRGLKLCFCGIYSEPGTFGRADDRSWELLEDMGIHREDVIDVRTPMQFKMLYVPEPGFEYEQYYHKEFRIPYKAIYDKVTPKNVDKLYLSRKRMGTTKEAGEEIIEKFFSMNGFKVIYPDELSILEQVSWYKGAKMIASVEGTISHNILFCTPGTEQIVIRKHTRIEPRHFLFNELMDSPVTYIDCLFNFIPKFPRHYDIGPFCMMFNRNIRRFARDNGYKLPIGWIWSNIVTMFQYCRLCIRQKRKERK